MNVLLNLLLTSVLNYGYPVIIVSILASSLAIPIPTSTLLMAAGSFSSNSFLNFYLVILISTTTSILGDSLGYFIGKKYGTKFKIKELRVNLLTIFLSRWLLLPICVPVNLLSGIQAIPFSKFILMVILGEFLWSFIYVYIGYLFGANWQSISDMVSKTPYVLTFGLLGIGIIFYVYRHRKNLFNTRKLS